MNYGRLSKLPKSALTLRRGVSSRWWTFVRLDGVAKYFRSIVSISVDGIARQHILHFSNNAVDDA